ncbi:hypothetical protein PoB_001295100 [Plakobranchus ocellatus]|uniref:Uncharacterized protein n=1 Tax=Plakobranchus ocellatus TaxID=259542 RepID=A0AAV3YSS4_9GAST|nr:hypothetical protein PoB_001295100 [Plakobranchus ocellatus]
MPPNTIQNWVAKQAHLLDSYLCATSASSQEKFRLKWKLGQTGDCKTLVGYRISSSHRLENFVERNFKESTAEDSSFDEDILDPPLDMETSSWPEAEKVTEHVLDEQMRASTDDDSNISSIIPLPAIAPQLSVKKLLVTRREFVVKCQEPSNDCNSLSDELVMSSKASRGLSWSAGKADNLTV